MKSDKDWDEEIRDLKALRAAKEGIEESVEKYVACQNKARDKALKDLMTMKLSYCPTDEFTKSDYYEEGDEDAPFFSEAYLYCLLGKDDARTVLAYLGAVLRASGYALGTSDIKLEQK